MTPDRAVIRFHGHSEAQDSEDSMSSYRYWPRGTHEGTKAGLAEWAAITHVVFNRFDRGYARVNAW